MWHKNFLFSWQQWTTNSKNSDILLLHFLEKYPFEWRKYPRNNMLEKQFLIVRKDSMISQINQHFRAILIFICICRKLRLPATSYSVHFSSQKTLVIHDSNTFNGDDNYNFLFQWDEQNFDSAKFGSFGRQPKTIQ